MLAGEGEAGELGDIQKEYKYNTTIPYYLLLHCKFLFTLAPQISDYALYAHGHGARAMGLGWGHSRTFLSCLLRLRWSEWRFVCSISHLLVGPLRVKHHQLLAGLAAAAAAAAAQLVIHQEDGGGDNTGYEQATDGSQDIQHRQLQRSPPRLGQGHLAVRHEAHVEAGEQQVAPGRPPAEPHPHVPLPEHGVDLGEGEEGEGWQQYEGRMPDQHLD